MSISPISLTSSAATSQLFGVSSSTSAFSLPPSSDNGSQANGISRFASAIQQAFASLGISIDGTSVGSSSASSTAASSTAASSDASSTTADSSASSDAVGLFLQSLFAALHSQSAGSAPPSSPSDDASTDSTSKTAAAGHGHGHHHHGGGGKIESDLQSLISDLSSSSSSTTDTSSSSTGTTTSTTGSDSALATLEKNFDTVLAQNGGTATTSSDALSKFLQSLAASLQGAPATGNVVSTEA